MALLNGQQITRIKLGDQILFEPAPMGDTLSSEERAKTIAEKVNQLLDSEPQVREVRVSSDHKTVIVRGCPIIEVTDEDVAFQKKPAEEIAKQAADAIRKVIWQELVQSFY